MSKIQNQSALDLGDTPIEAGNTAMKKAAGKGGRKATTSKETSPTDLKLRRISAADLQIHPLLGCTADELRNRYVVAVGDELDRFRRNVAPLGIPRVMAIEGSSVMGALTELPTAIAAMDRAWEGVPAMLSVIEVTDFVGAAFVAEMLAPKVGRSLWEQARALEGKRALHGTLREWMRSEKLDPAKWDSKCSKIAKVLDLPEAIRDKIDPFSITSAKDAGAVVALWADNEMRGSLEALLLAASAMPNGRIPAPPLFKAMLAEKAPSVLKPEWKEENGRKLLVDSGGRAIATMVVDGDGWSLTGQTSSGTDWKALAAALRTL